MKEATNNIVMSFFYILDMYVQEEREIVRKKRTLAFYVDSMLHANDVFALDYELSDRKNEKLYKQSISFSEQMHFVCFKTLWCTLYATKLLPLNS